MEVVKRVGYVMLLLLGALTLAWVLPFFYHLAFDQETDVPFTVYSGVTHTFAILGGDEHRYADDQGHVYTQEQFDSILPGLYYSQLASDGRFPDSLYGQSVTVEEMKQSFFVFHSKPREVNRVDVPLYPLLDADGHRVAFSEPSVAFRWGRQGIELLSIAENRVLQAKSQRFQEALGALVMPIRHTVGDPNVRKEYDNGYLIVDAANALYQLKQVDGAPLVRRLEAPARGKIDQVWLTEFEDMRSLGYLSTDDGGFYRIDARTGACEALPVGGYDPHRTTMVILGNKFDQTVKLIEDSVVRYVALSAGSAPQVLRTHRFVLPAMVSEQVGRYLVPFELAFSDRLSTQIYPRVEYFGWTALPLALLLAVATFFLFHRAPLTQRLFKALGVLVFGVYLLIPLLLWRS